jgi:hypothetical protein
VARLRREHGIQAKRTRRFRSIVEHHHTGAPGRGPHRASQGTVLFGLRALIFPAEMAIVKTVSVL